MRRTRWESDPGGNPRAKLKSMSHRCHPILVAFVWELTKETFHLPMGCLQGGEKAVRRPSVKWVGSRYACVRDVYNQQRKRSSAQRPFTPSQCFTSHANPTPSPPPRRHRTLLPAIENRMLEEDLPGCCCTPQQGASAQPAPRPPPPLAQGRALPTGPRACSRRPAAFLAV